VAISARGHKLVDKSTESSGSRVSTPSVCDHQIHRILTRMSSTVIIVNDSNEWDVALAFLYPASGRDRSHISSSDGCTPLAMTNRRRQLRKNFSSCDTAAATPGSHLLNAWRAVQAERFHDMAGLNASKHHSTATILALTSPTPTFFPFSLCTVLHLLRPTSLRV